MNTSGTLFWSVRRTGTAVLALMIVAVTERLLGASSVRFTGNSGLAVPWSVVAPSLAAAAVALATGTASPELERTSVRNIPMLRLIHASLLVILAATTGYLGTRELPGAIGAEAALRNVLGLSGLALLGAALFGAVWGWLLPAVIALLALTAGVTDGVVATWAWPLADNGDGPAWGAAVACLALGLLLVWARGARPAAPEEEED